MSGVEMSDGKKFIKTNANLSPEERLSNAERNFAVILERIQSYDQVLENFFKINSDIFTIKLSIKNNDDSNKEFNEEIKIKSNDISNKVNLLAEDFQKLSNSFNLHTSANDKSSSTFVDEFGKIYRESELLKSKYSSLGTEHAKTREVLRGYEHQVEDLKKHIMKLLAKFEMLSASQLKLREEVDLLRTEYKAKIEQLLSSFKEMPEFNEWSSKIYIKVCNELNEKQNQIYNELDKRSSQLKTQLSSDPYTAESVKKLLREEMETMSLDGKNAYIKASNAAQQIQILEKKLETVNLILKKYDLSK